MTFPGQSRVKCRDLEGFDAQNQMEGRRER